MTFEEIQELVKTDEGVNGELNGELNPSQKATLKFIMEHEGCTASEILVCFGKKS